MEPKEKINITIKTKGLVSISLIVIGVIGIIISVVLFAQQRTSSPLPPPGALTSKSAPSSTKLSQKTVAAYTVPATHPKFIAIPAINISQVPILRLGLLSSGAIAVPDNIYETGWFDGSSLPGQSGAMFIYGHVSSWTADGIFYNLKKLAAGDKVVITTGDNQTYIYQVVSSKVYPFNNVNMPQVLSPVNPNVPGLNLMTCTGQVIKGTSEFNERLVVFTSLVS